MIGTVVAMGRPHGVDDSIREGQPGALQLPGGVETARLDRHGAARALLPGGQIEGMEAVHVGGGQAGPGFEGGRDHVEGSLGQVDHGVPVIPISGARTEQSVNDAEGTAVIPADGLRKLTCQSRPAPSASKAYTLSCSVATKTAS